MRAATTSPHHVPFAAGRLQREAARARASELFVEHGALVERVCLALLRDRQEAEDAAQQSFLSAYRSLLAGNEPREEAAWLATIARNESLLRIRARMRRPIASVGLEEEAAPADVHRDAVARSHAAQLWQEIRNLPDQQRDAVILREFAGLSYEELAVALGISKPAVESLLFRARGRLRSRLETAVASLNLAGAASTVSDLLARIVGSGAVPRVAALPAAAKVAAATFGIALVGGGTAVVTERASAPHRRAVESAAAAQPAAPAAAAGPVPPTKPFAAVHSRTKTPPQVLLLASRHVAQREGTDGAAQEGDKPGSRSDGGDVASGSGEDRPVQRDHGDTTTTVSRSEGEGGGTRSGDSTTTTEHSTSHDGGASGSDQSGSDGGDDHEQGSTAVQSTTTDQTTTTTTLTVSTSEMTIGGDGGSTPTSGGDGGGGSTSSN